MSRPISIMSDAFDHHVWATLQLIDTCLDLDEDQLGSDVRGTYGSILDTMRHLVAADCSYLNLLSGGRIDRIPDEASLGLVELRLAMAANGQVWAELLAGDLDPEQVLVRRHDDGSESHAPLGIRLAQAIHHGTDHRSQVCTALTNLGVTPPAIDVWDFAASHGRLEEVAAPGR
jgi:uncharacterized damage-inducible protein DinB